MKGRWVYDRERGVGFMLGIQLFPIWIDKTLESPAASVNVTFGPFWCNLPNSRHSQTTPTITITQQDSRKIAPNVLNCAILALQEFASRIPVD